MKYVVFILLISVSGIAQTTIDEALKKYNSNTVEYISVDQLAELLQKKPYIKLLDARAKSEFTVSHFKDAIHVGYKKFDLAKLPKKLQKKDTLIVYCSVGVRSEQIGEQLQKAGFTNVFNLYGGIFQWQNQENPVFNQQGAKTDSIHAYDKKWGKFIENGIKVYE